MAGLRIVKELEKHFAVHGKSAVKMNRFALYVSVIPYQTFDDVSLIFFFG